MSLAVPGSGCGHVWFLENPTFGPINTRLVQLGYFVSRCRQDIYLAIESVMFHACMMNDALYSKVALGRPNPQSSLRQDQVFSSFGQR